MTETILANAQLVLPDEVIHGSLVMRDGVFAEIDQGGAVPKGAIDCEGDLVTPGLVELHTDNLERHMQPRPNVDWPHTAAIVAHDAELAGVGITTVFDAMRVGSNPKGLSAFKPYARQMASEILALRDRGALRISHFLHLRAEICTDTLAEEFAAFTAEDRVRLVSLMDHTPGQRQFRDLTKLRQYLMGKHAMTEDEFTAHVAERKAFQTEVGPKNEALAVAEAVRLGAALASHDDTTAEQVTVSANHGVRLAEFPTTEEAAQACRAAGIAVMMGAPNLIRGGSHSGNVAAETLAQSGLLDIVSSDYVPAALLAAALHLSDLWDNPAAGLATVTSAPANATGLADRGRLAPGLRADLLRVTRFDRTPVVRATWVRGQRVA